MVYIFILQDNRYFHFNSLGRLAIDLGKVEWFSRMNQNHPRIIDYD